ncbi:MAG: trehalose-6-phosphate synthase [Vicinamibacterales bacterium]
MPAGEPAVRQHRHRRNRHGARHRLRAGLPLRATAAGWSAQARPKRHRLPSSEKRIPWPKQRRRSASVHRETRSWTGCWATTCSASYRYHCNNFFDPVDSCIEARIDREHFATWCGASTRTFVKPFPISIDPKPWAQPAAKEPIPRRGRGPDAHAARAEVRTPHLRPRSHGPTKGHPRADQGLRADARAVSGVASGSPWCRSAPEPGHLQRYQSLSDDVDVAVRRISNASARTSGRPCHACDAHEPEDVAALYRAADVCVVSSLHDGMNLVAKEFIASRPDLRGVLVLSRFTGAVRELREAVDVNPFAVDEFAGVLHDALSMPEAEQARRMRALRARVEEHTIYDWAANVIQAAWRMSEAAA